MKSRHSNVTQLNTFSDTGENNTVVKNKMMSRRSDKYVVFLVIIVVFGLSFLEPFQKCIVWGVARF